MPTLPIRSSFLSELLLVGDPGVPFTAQMPDAPEPERRKTADGLKQVLDHGVDAERLRAKFDVSHFDLNAMIRGAQLTLVGG